MVFYFTWGIKQTHVTLTVKTHAYKIVVLDTLFCGKVWKLVWSMVQIVHDAKLVIY